MLAVAHLTGTLTAAADYRNVHGHFTSWTQFQGLAMGILNVHVANIYVGLRATVQLRQTALKSCTEPAETELMIARERPVGQTHVGSEIIVDWYASRLMTPVDECLSSRCEPLAGTINIINCFGRL